MWSHLKPYLVYFLTGGLVTTAIVYFEQSDNRLISGFATLVPVFTVVAYVFIGESKGGTAVGQHAWLVLVGTLLAWVPYMITVALLAPKLGSARAVPIGLGVFFTLAFAYLEAVRRWHWFQ